VNEDLKETAGKLCKIHIPFKALTGRETHLLPVLKVLDQFGTMGAIEGAKLASRVFKDYSTFKFTEGCVSSSDELFMSP
jgi:hypothetical protein